ncbi:MAG: hypothetical protein RIQ93_1923 [Verrucomicrobiota bacterium]|jgi:pimeloyl-ACP methyl ester carboxylesterase
MKRHHCITAGALCLLALCGAHAAPAERFSIAAMGCLPYGAQNYPAYERLLAEINRHAPAFTVHCGDTKGGSEAPSEAFLLQVRTWFNSIDGPVMYTPGDNEWTDVHRDFPSEDPLVWLQKVRKIYFAEERSLGRAPIPLITQRRDAAYAKFVENARWTHNGVVFATIHMVGSNNNDQPQRAGAVAEFQERDAANAAWMRATFAAAREANAPAVGLFFQAMPFKKGPTAVARTAAFANFTATLEAEARRFKKPVLIVHADEHRYRYDPAIPFETKEAQLTNVTRVETFGDNDAHGVLVVVDPVSPQVFLAGPLLVPGNALPILTYK